MCYNDDLTLDILTLLLDFFELALDFTQCDQFIFRGYVFFLDLLEVVLSLE